MVSACFSLPNGEVSLDLGIKDRGVASWYGKEFHGKLAANGVFIAEGELVSLLGRNGAGKTTTLKALMGLEVRRSGSVVLSGRELIAARSYHIARCGMAYCPEDRGIFLKETWRMAPSVCAFTSESFYERRLNSRPGLELPGRGDPAIDGPRWRR